MTMKRTGDGRCWMDYEGQPKETGSLLLCLFHGPLMCTMTPGVMVHISGTQHGTSSTCTWYMVQLGASI